MAEKGAVSGDASIAGAAPAGAAPSKVDLSGQRIRKLQKALSEQPQPFVPSAITSLTLDQNLIARLEGLDGLASLQQLSVGFNRLQGISGLDRLSQLTVLSLPNNNIDCIEGLENLPQLLWLNLSGNSIKMIGNLERNVNLKHLDLSDNAIEQLSDLTHLTSLKTLLLHGNAIASVESADRLLPAAALRILSLAENDIGELCEVTSLGRLRALDQLSLMNNPCLSYLQLTHQSDAYRAFVLSCCTGLKALDARKVDSVEREKATWLSRDVVLPQLCSRGASQRIIDRASELLRDFHPTTAAPVTAPVPPVRSAPQLPAPLVHAGGRASPSLPVSVPSRAASAISGGGVASAPASPKRFFEPPAAALRRTPPPPHERVQRHQPVASPAAVEAEPMRPRAHSSSISPPASPLTVPTAAAAVATTSAVVPSPATAATSAATSNAAVAFANHHDTSSMSAGGGAVAAARAAAATGSGSTFSPGALRRSLLSSPGPTRRSPTSSSQAFQQQLQQRGAAHKGMSPVRSLSPARPSTRGGDAPNGPRDRTDLEVELQRGLRRVLTGELSSWSEQQQQQQHRAGESGATTTAASKESAAAVKIQAHWRGYRCRNLDQRVANLMRDLRIQRLEEHLTAVLFEMQRRHELSLEEERLRAIHTQALCSLTAKVKQLEAVIESLQHK